MTVGDILSLSLVLTYVVLLVLIFRKVKRIESILVNSAEGFSGYNPASRMVAYASIPSHTLGERPENGVVQQLGTSMNPLRAGGVPPDPNYAESDARIAESLRRETSEGFQCPHRETFSPSEGFAAGGCGCSGASSFFTA